MRSLLLPALFTSYVANTHAAPTFFGSAKALLSQVNSLTGNLGLSGIEHALGLSWSPEEETRVLSSFVESSGVQYQKIQLESLQDHSLRISTTNSTLCDPGVKQQSGYLDVTDGKHLFFWYFEAREAPEEKPLLLWLNGGPGCSSSTGLLFELGPCSIRYNTSASNPYPYTEINPYSWTNHANVIFLDQPTNVGFSYSTDGSTVNASPVAAKDVYAFLQLFLAKYSSLRGRDFHVAAESYGGTYAPNIGKVIYEGNTGLERMKSQSFKVLSSAEVSMVKDFHHIPLKSIILANGLSEPYTQFASIPDYLCDGPYAPLDPDGSECASLSSKVPTCQSLIKRCYKSGSRFACVPAGLYCNSQLMSPVVNLGLNPYDLRKKCDHQKDGDLCYKQMSWIDEWLNKKEVKEALGAPLDRTFESCNMEVNQAFFFQGDGMHNSAALLLPLLNDGVKLLVYAGNADGMCNYMGNFNWMLALEGHPFAVEFRNATTEEWHLPSSSKRFASPGSVDIEDNVGISGKVVGEFRAAYGGAKTGSGNYVFVNVHEAGHMVPYDQPEAALDLLGRWLKDKRFD